MLKRYILMVVPFLFPLMLGSHISFAREADSPDGGGREKNPLSSKIWAGKTFTRFTYEEDIKDTLRAIAGLIDMPISFGEGITDTVTMEFKNMPLKDAFEFLIDQCDLEYSMDNQVIHVYKTDVGGMKDELIVLKDLEIDEVKSAIERFGFMKKDVKIFFDPPSNAIRLTGPQKDVDNIIKIIKAMESAKKDRIKVRPEIRYFPLKYAKVNTITLTIGRTTVTVKGLTEVLTEILGLTRAGEPTVREIRYAAEEREPMRPPPTARNIVVAPEAEAELHKRLIGAEAGTITSDLRTNRIIIRDYPDKLDEYAEIIKQLDKPTKMIKIDVIIVEAAKDFAREVGVGNALFKPSEGHRRRYFFGSSESAREVFDREQFGEPQDALTLMPLLESAAGTPTTGGLAGTFLYEGSRYTLITSLRLAEVKGLSKTINKSSIITMDNMQAIVESKTTVTFKIQSGGDNPTVEDRDIEAGLVLTVSPHIIEDVNNEHMVELVVRAERSSFLATRTDDIPEKATTTMTTQAVIGDKNTLVVGGLFDHSYSVGESGVPCLMNIPGLGNLFKTSSASNPKSNILFFMTPEVISLDNIPYEGRELNQKIDKSEDVLKKIDPDRQEKWIERDQY